MTRKRHPMPALALLAALALAALAVGCGGGSSSEKNETPTSPMGTHMQTAMDQVNAMIAAAEKGDLQAAEAAFEDGHDALHGIADDLKASNPNLSSELDEAVDDTENDFEESADADHIVEIGNEILDLLEQVE